MAISTYAELQTSIILWADRVGETTFASVVPDFIALCESALSLGSEGLPQIRTRDMETSASLSVVDGLASLPTGYLEFIMLKSADNAVLEPTVESSAAAQYRYRTAGKPNSFIVTGSQIQTFPSSTETMTLSYYSKIPALSDSNTTNWLLTKSPNTYLFGALYFAAAYMEDEPSQARYGRLYQQAITGLTSADARSKNIRAVSKTRGYRV